MTMSAGAVGAAVLSYAPEEQSASQDAVDLLDDASSATETAHLKHLPLTSLIRGYLVFTITSSPLLVDMAPRIVDAMAYIKDTLPLGIGSLIHSTYLLVSGLQSDLLLERLAGMGVGISRADPVPSADR